MRRRRTKNVAVSMPRTNLSIKADDDPLLELSDVLSRSEPVKMETSLDYH